jgi:hypothetical protein
MASRAEVEAEQAEGETLQDMFTDDRTVHQRMLAIIAELPAIGKDQYNPQQKFHFRGHDDVMNALNPLLARHGVFFVPDVLDRVTSQRATKSGSTMYEVNLHVRFTFWGARGDQVTASGWGEGTDMGDKATSKAMTMALKYVLAQTFALSTAETSDPDGQTPEETGGTSRGREPARKNMPGGWGEIADRWAALFGGAKDDPYGKATARWYMQRVARALGYETVSALPDEKKRAAGAVLANTVVDLEDAHGDLILTTDVRGKVQSALAQRMVMAGDEYAGTVVDGPGWAMDSTEAASRPQYGQDAVGATETAADDAAGTDTPAAPEASVDASTADGV